MGYIVVLGCFGGLLVLLLATVLMRGGARLR